MVGSSKHAVVEEFRRDTILNAARHVIARRGLGGASMQAIADEANVAKGTLYLYFADRSELLEQAADWIFDELLARAKAELTPDRSLRDGLRALFRTQLEFFEKNREFLRVYMEMRDPDGAGCHRRRRRPQFVRHLEHLRGFLAGCAHRGEMKPFDPERVALFFIEGTSALLKQRLLERGRKTVEDVEWIVDLLLDGICKGSAS